MDFRPGALEEPIAGRRWRGEDVAREIADRAARYRAAPVAPGDRVFLLHGNSLEFFADLIALWSIGACAVPVDSRLVPSEIEMLASAARPRWVLADARTGAAAMAALAATGAARLDEAAGARAAGPMSAAAVPFSGHDRAALILFTSGTTGDPKGVVHTPASLAARWSDLRQALGVRPFRRTLCLLPTHFGHGLICNALYPWLSGCDLLLAPPFQPDILMRLGAIVDDHEVTFLSSVPAMWHLTTRIARPPRRAALERVICGSAPLSGDLWRRIRSWTGTDEVLNVYGITETASWTAGTTVDGAAPEDGLIGVGWGTEIRIRSSGDVDTPLDQGVLPAGAPGHVWLRTPALMQGYLDRDDLTAAVVRDGWFSTGDLGRVDDRGCLYLSGREREEINRGGLKIHPQDVDLAAARHEAVLDVCTFGVAHPVYGQEAAIALVLSAHDPATLRSVYGHLTRHLAPHQLPQHWFLAEAIPRTSRGKVNRQAVAAAGPSMTRIDLREVLHEA